MQDLIYKHKVAPLPSDESALGNQVSLMHQGKLAMQLTNPGGNANYKPVAGMPYDAGVFPLGGGARRGVGGGGTGWAGSAQSKLQEEAWRFVAYLASKDAELDEVRIGQTTPSRISVATGPELWEGKTRRDQMERAGFGAMRGEHHGRGGPDVARRNARTSPGREPLRR
jgi:ABC-type glycerol-3-phosphate transport system substrate-binding protein